MPLNSLMASQPSELEVLRANSTLFNKARGYRSTFAELSKEDRQEIMEIFEVLVGDEAMLDYKCLTKAADAVLGPGQYRKDSLDKAIKLMDLKKSTDKSCGKTVRIDFIAFRGFMSHYYNSVSKDASAVMGNSQHEDDFIMVNDQMRFVDMLKSYRRRVLVMNVINNPRSTVLNAAEGTETRTGLYTSVPLMKISVMDKSRRSIPDHPSSPVDLQSEGSGWQSSSDCELVKILDDEEDDMTPSHVEPRKWVPSNIQSTPLSPRSSGVKSGGNVFGPPVSLATSHLAPKAASQSHIQIPPAATHRLARQTSAQNSRASGSLSTSPSGKSPDGSGYRQHCPLADQAQGICAYRPKDFKTQDSCPMTPLRETVEDRHKLPHFGTGHDFADGEGNESDSDSENDIPTMGSHDVLEMGSDNEREFGNKHEDSVGQYTRGKVRRLRRKSLSAPPSLITGLSYPPPNLADDLDDGLGGVKEDFTMSEFAGTADLVASAYQPGPQTCTKSQAPEKDPKTKAKTSKVLKKLKELRGMFGHLLKSKNERVDDAEEIGEDKQAAEGGPESALVSPRAMNKAHVRGDQKLLTTSTSANFRAGLREPSTHGGVRGGLRERSAHGGVRLLRELSVHGGARAGFREPSTHGGQRTGPSNLNLRPRPNLSQASQETLECLLAAKSARRD